MSKDTRHPERGFTLLELIVVIALLGLLSSLATDFMVNETNQQRYETTQQRMEKIRYAIIGDVSRTLNGQPVFSGFFADEGEVPTSLTQLTLSGHCDGGTGNNASECATNGGSWKSRNGPYLSVTDLKDGWGNNFIYTNSDEIVITSLGLDRIIGTTSTNPNDATYETDQKLSIPVSHYAELPFKITQQRMEKIRYAIIGDVSRTLNGQPVFSGFIADEGEVPTSLTQLTLSGHCDGGTGNNASDCATDGGSWKSRNGPYLSVTDLQDGWGNNFIYTSAGDIVIKSQGLDDTSGTTSSEQSNVIYEEDQSLTIPASHYAGAEVSIDLINNTGEPDGKFCLFSTALPSAVNLNATPLISSITPSLGGKVIITVLKKVGAITTDCSSTVSTGFTYTANSVYVHNLVDSGIPVIHITLDP